MSTSPLEPGTNVSQWTVEQMATMSIAISLKRIADAMTETNEFGENTAEAVGGHVKRAMNDISATIFHAANNRR